MNKKTLIGIGFLAIILIVVSVWFLFKPELVNEHYCDESISCGWSSDGMCVNELRADAGVVVTDVSCSCNIAVNRCEVKGGFGRSTKAPIDIELSSSAVALNKQATITATLTADIDTNSSAEIVLPNKLQYVDGDLTWSGELQADQPVTFSVTVKAIEVGYAQVNSSLIADFGQAVDIIYFEIGQTSGQISDQPLPENEWVSNMAIPLSENYLGIESSLTLSAFPELNKEVDLIYTVTSSKDLQDARVFVILPNKGIEVISVNTPVDYQTENQFSIRKDIAAGETVQISLAIKTVLEGEGELYGYLNVQQPEFIQKTNLMYIKANKYEADYSVKQVIP